MVAHGRGPSINAVAIAFLVVNLCAIALRCYTRIKISRVFDYNDAGMLLCMVVYIVLVALLVVGVSHGIGSTTFSNSIEDIGECLKYVWLLEIIYVLLTSIFKASIALTLLQWARSKTQRILLWAAIFVDFVICMVVVFITIFKCSPISYAWEWLDFSKQGKCMPDSEYAKVGYALCGITVGLDMLFLILPCFMMREHRMTKQLKAACIGILCLAVVASVANFIRLAALVKLTTSADPLLDAADVFIWSVVEVSLGVVVAGIMELRPLLQRYNVPGFEKKVPDFLPLGGDGDAEAMNLTTAIKSSSSSATQEVREKKFTG